MNLKEKLSELIFLEVKTKELEKLLNVNIDWNEAALFMPISASYLSKNINDNNKIDNIPVSEFIFGMTLTIGCDKEFRFNNIYKNLIREIPDAVSYIKSVVANLVKDEKLVSAYALLKGLIEIEVSEDNYEKALIVIEALRQKNKEYKDEELIVIEDMKDKIQSPLPYFYESLIYKDDERYDMAMISLDTYFEKGGKRDAQILEFEEWLRKSSNYEKAKEVLYEDPAKALELFLPLLEENSDNPLIYYHIAVAYRLIDNYEKAIYYLNESVNLDDNILEVVNELGLNYASLGDYESALTYFKKAFEVTGNIEFCTNIIMCYLNLNNMKEAKKYFEKGEQIDKEDEILKDIKRYF